MTLPVIAAPSSRPRDGLWAWLAVVLLAALALIPLAKAWGEAQDLGHGWAAPLLMAYLWWERWDQRPSGVRRERIGLRWWILAMIFVVVALPLRLLLTPFPLWPMAVAGYVAVLAAAGLTASWLAARREGLRWMGGPLIIMLGVLPWPSTLEMHLVAPLREMIASTAAEICYLLGIPALATGTTLRLAHTWVGVDETCGGMRSLQAAVMAALFFGEWLLLSGSRRVALVGIGIASAILGNFLRILFLVWRASSGGESALAAAHDPAGVLALTTSLVLTGLAARALRPPSRESAPRSASRVPLPRAALLWAGIITLALGCIEVGTRGWYARGDARRAASVPQWQIRFPGRGSGFVPVPLATAAREMLRPDYFSAGTWQSGKGQPVSAYYVEWHRGQAARSIPFLHNPTVCLPMAGCELVRPAGTVSIPWAGSSIPFHCYVFRRAAEEFVVAFVIWDPTKGAPMADTAAGWRNWMSTQLSDVREARRDQPAQLLSVAVWGDEAARHIQDVLGQLIVSVDNH